MVTGTQPAMNIFLDPFPLPNSSYAPGAVAGLYQCAGASRDLPGGTSFESAYVSNHGVT